MRGSHQLQFLLRQAFGEGAWGQDAYHAAKPGNTTMDWCPPSVLCWAAAWVGTRPQRPDRKR